MNGSDENLMYLQKDCANFGAKAT